MKYALLALLVLMLAVAGLGLTPVQATSAVACAASPSSGPPGTIFLITCNNFAKNEIVNTYLVEPDGRAIAGGEPDGVGAFTSPSNPHTDSTGTATFSFHTRSGHAFAHVGAWTVVVDQPHGVSGMVVVDITSNSLTVSGGALTVTPAAGRSFTFMGTGWAKNESVDIWLTMPSNCSGTSGSVALNLPDDDRTALGAVDPSFYNTSYGWDFPGDHPKTDASGTWTFSLKFRDYACTGIYTLTARALGSGIGAQVDFVVNGNAVVLAGSASITVTPAPWTSARNPWLTVSGTGFPSGGTCWATRPDGRAIMFENFLTAGGSFSVSGYAEDVDATESYEAFSETAEPGWWSMTCRTTNGSTAAETNFLLNALTVDP